MNKYPDIKTVAAAALQRINYVLAHLLPDGKADGVEYKARNPLRDDSKLGSFSINLHSGAWGDFATGDKGGDLVALWCYLQRCKDQGEASQQLAEFLQLDLTHAAANASHATQQNAKGKRTAQGIEWRGVVPVPDNAPPPPDLHFKHGRATLFWDYRDPQNRLLMRMNRFDLGKDANKKMQKEFAPQTWCAEFKNGEATGRHEWRWQGLDAPRPLYGLDKLSKRPDALVVICEGEKAADAAGFLFPDAVAMAWPSGSNAVNKTDFAPLAGRSVLFWPDNDAPGIKAVKLLGAALQLVDVISAELVRIESFGEFFADGTNKAPRLSQGGEWLEGDDADDAFKRGWTPAHITLLDARGLLRERFPDALRGINNKSEPMPPPEKENTPVLTENASTPMFHVSDDGVFWYNEKQQRYIKISDKVEIVARTRFKQSNRDASGWGKLLRFCNHDGEIIQWNIPDQLFAAEGQHVIAGLFDRGLFVSPHEQAKRKLRDFIFGAEVPERVRLVDKMGWHDGAFVLPDRVIGSPPEPLHYHVDASSACKMRSAGTLEQWREHVAQFAIGNDLMLFALSAAFAAPLLEMRGQSTIGFHFYGSSSWGKSTLLEIAATIYGKPGLSGYVHKWRATDNALEALAAAHSDCLFLLDELKQCDPRIVDQTVYMLGNGEGKARALENGSSGGTKHQWRLVVLSNGEITLSEHLGSVKMKTHAGQEIRFLHILANFNESNDVREKQGIFQNLHQFSHGSFLSKQLINNGMKYHGTAFPAFLEKLLAPEFTEKGQKWISGKVEKFKQDCLTNHASGQAHRAADAFGLIAAAGEMATRFGITGWADGDATKAAARCFKEWLNYFGGEGNKEQRDMLEAVRTHFAMSGEFNYTRMNENEPIADEHAPRTSQRFGFRETRTDGDNSSGRYSETIYYVLPDAFKKEICKGFNATHVAELLAQRGALQESGDKTHKYQQRKRLPGYGKTRPWVYVINPALLADDEGDDTDTKRTAMQGA